MFTNCKTILSVDSWPPEKKDIQVLISKELYILPLWRSAIKWQIHFMICVQFQGSISCFGFNWFKIHFLLGLELILIPAQTGNEIVKMYTNCTTSLSVDSWPPERKDIQLQIIQELHVLPLWRSAIDWQIRYTICVHFHSCINLKSISCLGSI